MADEKNLKYLDLAGLTTLVGKLKGVMDTKDEAVTDALTTKIKEECFGKVEYVSSAKKIYFYGVDGSTLLGEVDATDFIKDGMVENVEIKDGKLVITFNTDSDRDNDTIEIELTEIFDPDNFYDKDDIDAKITALETADSNNKSELEGAIDDAKTELEGKITALESEINTTLGNYYTKSEVDDLLEEIEGTIESLEGTVNSNKTELEGKISDVSTDLDNYKEEVTKTLEDYVLWEAVSTISTAEIEGLFTAEP